MRGPLVTRLFVLLVLALLPVVSHAQKAEVSAAPDSDIPEGGRGSITATFVFDPTLHQTRQEQFFYLRLDPDATPRGMTAGDAIYPEGTDRDGTTWYDSPVSLVLPVSLADTVTPGIYTLGLLASYQLCESDGLCYLPQKVRLETKVVVSARSTGAVAVAGGAAAPLTGATAVTLRLLLLAFVGGLLLNFMPCVLPVLSIKALGLVKQAGQDRRALRASGVMYGTGVVASFLGLAALVVALKASGELVGWGFQFQNPGYVIALLAVVFVFALSLFDVFTIQLPVGGLAVRAGGARGHLGSFLGGVMAVLLATPCTAPFLGTALGYAFSQPAPVIFLMFALVGLGLAFPFALLSFLPGLAKVLPRPGAWTAVFRTVMGFLLVGTAVFLFDVLARQVDAARSVRVLVFLAVLAFAAWIYGRFGPTAARWKRWTALAVAVLISTVGGLATLRAPAAVEAASFDLGEPVSAVKAGWEPFSPERVEGYRAAGEPVFLAFGAQWCWSCRVNESAVLDRPEVREAFTARGVRLVYGDWTNADDEISAWLTRYERAGVPLYLYYASGAEAVVLPELLTRRMVLDLLEG